MGFLNQFQLSPGARTPGADNIYVTGLVKDKGTQGVSGDTITFTNLTVELDGNDFTATKALDFGTLGTLVAPGKDYLICAVPSYTEPVDKTAAEAAGMDYFVQNNARGEGVAYRFFPTDVQTAITAGGGINAIADRVLMGGATSSDVSLYNYYYETVEDLNDPRYTGVNPFLPVSFDFVLAELVYQDNSSKENALLTKTQVEWNILKAQLGEVYSMKKVLTIAQANTRYAGRLWMIKSAKGYASQANALADVSGTSRTAAIKTALDAGTSYTFASPDTHVAVQEYVVPANMPMGQTHKGYSVLRWLDKQAASGLGRINPIYLDNQALTGSVRFPTQAMSRLTRFADPLPLARVTLGGVPGTLTIPTVTYVFDTGIY